MTAREVLDGIRDRLTKATPGPWAWDEEGFMGCGQVYTMHPDVLGGNIAAPSGDLYPRSGYSPKDDMQFIAAAPVDVARLTRAVEQVLGVVDTYPYSVMARDVRAAIEDALNP